MRENIEAVLVAILLALFIRTFMVQAFKIPSGSMKETLQIGDHILVNKFAYGVKIPYLGIKLMPVSKPANDDIVVFKFPEDPNKDFIKRVIGIAGDVVEIINKQLYLNGKPITRDFAVFKDSSIIQRNRNPRDNFGPITVPENCLFVMGDNRDHSYDSRFWKFVELDAVKGKAFIIYYSWDSESFGVRWKRLGNLLK
ncbi:signal peptidase I [Desulfobacterales bacterium HSG16]|nr:signal peptidase I [Desulfobacterales bacterium HSG16]